MLARINKANSISLFFLVFSFVSALRYYENSNWLSDQIDQIQNFAGLLKLEARSFYGAWMSGTDPQVKTLGPMGAILFSFPTLFGIFDGNILHLWGILGLCLSLAFVCREIALIWGTTASILYGSLVICSKLWIWATALLWSNTWILVWAFLALGVFLRFLRKHQISDRSLWVLLLLFATGIQIHVICFVFIIWFLSSLRFVNNLRRLIIGSFMILGISFTPYIYAEFRHNFSNFSAILQHIRQKSITNVKNGSTTASREIFEYIYSFFNDAIGIYSLTFLVLAVGFFWVATLRKKHLRLRLNISLVIPLACFCYIAAYIAFFWKLNRTILSPHYLLPIVPIIASFPVFLFPRPIMNHNQRKVLAAIYGCIIMLIWYRVGNLPFQRVYPEERWSFNNITSSLKELCNQTGGEFVATQEGSGLHPYTPGYQSVLGFTINKFPELGCKLTSRSDPTWIINPAVHEPLLPIREWNNLHYRLVHQTHIPMGLYKRIDEK